MNLRIGRVAIRCILAAFFILVSLGSMNCGPKVEMLRIGVLFPLTGEAGSYGEKGRDAVLLAQADVNSKGGVRGQHVEVYIEDSRADPATGVSAARKLITANHVVGIDGDIVSAVTLAVAPVVEANHVVLISPTSSAPAITNAGEYVYRVWPSDLEEGRAIANYAAKAGYRRAAVLYMNNDYGQAIAGIFKNTFESDGGRVLLSEGYQADEADFRSLLVKVRSERPDVLYIAGYFADTATLCRQARDVGLAIPLLGTTAVEDPQFLKLAGASAEGMVYPLATGFDPSDKGPVVASFVEAFKRKYGRDPGWVEAHAYDAFMLLCYAAERTDPPVTGTKMKAALDHMGDYHGVTGTIRFDANGDVVKPIVLKTIHNGRFLRLQ